MDKNRVCYVWDQDLIQQCDCLPAVIGRVCVICVFLNRNLNTKYDCF